MNEEKIEPCVAIKCGRASWNGHVDSVNGERSTIVRITDCTGDDGVTSLVMVDIVGRSSESGEVCPVSAAASARFFVKNEGKNTWYVQGFGRAESYDCRIYPEWSDDVRIYVEHPYHDRLMHWSYSVCVVSSGAECTSPHSCG